MSVMALSDSVHAGVSKRIRQACASCRRKKIKCSGEQPICQHCRRSSHSCVYEPYSATVGDVHQPVVPAPASGPEKDNAALLRRISTIESRLAELSEQKAFHAPSANHAPENLHELQFENASAPSDTAVSQFSSNRDALYVSLQPVVAVIRAVVVMLTGDDAYSSLPPSSVMPAVIDTYFTHVHNQPYSYFHEPSFREKLANQSLPRCLVLAVLASAVRFSKHEYYAGRAKEATEAYSRESWLAVLSDHLTIEENMNLSVVQTMTMLAVADYTAGRVSSGWLKIGLAARISQDLQMMKEAGDEVSPVEKEERRRAFWSTYLIDKLISCGRSRPLAILDDDCNVLLPCDEEAFQPNDSKKAPTLDQLRSWDSSLAERPSPFALVILMASILGTCTSYIHRRCNKERIPPWDPRSEFSSITSSLLLLESYSGVGIESISESITSGSRSNQRQMGHRVFAQTLFHLCHCLLGHPFLVHLHLKPFGSKTPASFVTRMLQTGCDHAKYLLDFLQSAGDLGCLVESSFYPYCIAVAGGIHSLNSQFHQDRGDVAQTNDALDYFNRSMRALERLGGIWIHASNMITRLRDFHSRSHQYTHLLDPGSLMVDLSPDSLETFWSMIDYGSLGSGLRNQHSSSTGSLSHLSAPSPWGFSMGMSPGFANGGLFGVTPSMQLDDVENLLDYSPRSHGLYS